MGVEYTISELFTLTHWERGVIRRAAEAAWAAKIEVAKGLGVNKDLPWTMLTNEAQLEVCARCQLVYVGLKKDPSESLVSDKATIEDSAFFGVLDHVFRWMLRAKG